MENMQGTGSPDKTVHNTAANYDSDNDISGQTTADTEAVDRNKLPVRKRVASQVVAGKPLPKKQSQKKQTHGINGINMFLLPTVWIADYIFLNSPTNRNICFSNREHAQPF